MFPSIIHDHNQKEPHSNTQFSLHYTAVLLRHTEIDTNISQAWLSIAPYSSKEVISVPIAESDCVSNEKLNTSSY